MAVERTFVSIRCHQTVTEIAHCGDHFQDLRTESTHREHTTPLSSAAALYERRDTGALSCRHVNQMRTRLQSLGLLGRAFRAASDDELEAMLERLDDEHREAIEPLGVTDAASMRQVVNTGRLDGTMESLAAVLTDGCLADCIEQLGDHADHPSTDQVREVLPGLIERHGLAETRLMLASTVAGEANAAAIIRDLLKHDETVKLPPPESPPVVIPERADRDDDSAERQTILARRKEQRKLKQAEARTRRQQAQQARSKR